VSEHGNVTGTGQHSYADRGHDVYETPECAVHALLREESFHGAIWEPACGPGAIVRVLREASHTVVASDLQNLNCPDSRYGVDFLKEWDVPSGCSTLVDKFVRHALDLVPRVVMFARLLYLEGVKRSDVLDDGHLRRVYVFKDRLPMMHRMNWDGPKNTTAMQFAWFCWDREY
jgi:hypothetical protein